MPRNPTSARAIKMKESGYIYFLLHGIDYWLNCNKNQFYHHKTESFLKIGYTSDVQARIPQLQCGNPYRLKLLGYINGGIDLEHKLHTWLQPHRYCKGNCISKCLCEWFVYNYSTAKYVDSLRGLFIEEKRIEPLQVRKKLVVRKKPKKKRTKEELTLIRKKAAAKKINLESLAIKIKVPMLKTEIYKIAKSNGIGSAYLIRKHWAELNNKLMKTNDGKFINKGCL